MHISYANAYKYRHLDVHIIHFDVHLNACAHLLCHKCIYISYTNAIIYRHLHVDVYFEVHWAWPVFFSSHSQIFASILSPLVIFQHPAVVSSFLQSIVRLHVHMCTNDLLQARDTCITTVCIRVCVRTHLTAIDIIIVISVVEMYCTSTGYIQSKKSWNSFNIATCI